MDEVKRVLRLTPPTSFFLMNKDSIYYSGGLRLHRHQQGGKIIDDDFDPFLPFEEEYNDPPPPCPPSSSRRGGVGRRSERQKKVT